MIKSFLEFEELYEKQKRKKLSELRDHAMWFVKGLEKAKKLKNEIMKINDKEHLIRFIRSI